jgi:hypothetical protein
LWGLALVSGIRHAAAGRHTLSLPGLWIKPTGFRRVFVWSFVLTYGKVLLSAKSECLSRWGVIKMLHCQICAKPVDVLAHQVRDSGIEFSVCLDCANDFYQDKINKLVASVVKECI